MGLILGNGSTVELRIAVWVSGTGARETVALITMDPDTRLEISPGMVELGSGKGTIWELVGTPVLEMVPLPTMDPESVAFG